MTTPDPIPVPMPVSPLIPLAPPAPSQVRHPWRATARTVIQFVPAVAVLAPSIYEAATSHDPTLATGVVGVALGVAGGVTRIMQMPKVNDLLTRLGLGAEPKSTVMTYGS